MNINIDLDYNGWAASDGENISLCGSGIEGYFELKAKPITLSLSRKKTKESYKIKFDRQKENILFLDIESDSDAWEYLYSYTSFALLNEYPQLGEGVWYVSILQEE